MRNTIKNITFFAALALMSVSCVEDKMGGYINDGVIRYELDNAAPVVAKSAQDAEELSPIVLTSEDGKYSFTLQRSVRPTLLQEAASKAAPVTGKTLKDNYNDGSLQITAFKGTDTYMSQQKLSFVSQEAGQTASLWKTETISYWPETGSLDFWSWAPASESAADGKISGVAFNEDKSELSFSYTSPKSSAEVGCDAELQKDVLLAHDLASDSDNRNVSLMYKHALSAICFQMDRAQKCTVKSISIGNVYGSAKCTFDGTTISWSDYTDATTFTETFNKEIDKYLEDDYANPQSLSTDPADAGKTMLLIPQSATDAKKVKMTLVMRLDGESEDTVLEAELSPDDAIWEAGWTYTYGICKDAYLEVTGEVKMNYIATEGTNTYIVNSNKPWQLQYTLDDGATWTDAEENTTIDGWISFDKVSGVGSGDDETVTATVNEAVPEPITITVDHTSILRNATPRGTADAPWDLSTHDIDGNLNLGGKATTANCYVISAPGWYAIPLVYGNAIKGGIDNTPAYKNTSGTLTNFKKADGNDMTSPYIEGVTTAFPLWEDVAAFAIVADDGCVVLSQADAAAKGLTACNCGYIMFEVKSATIKQGNAVIAVTDENGIIQWSWHIWVTDDELTTTVVTNHDGTFNKNMLQLNLGWVDDSNETDALKYNDASLKLRFVQKSGTSIIDEVPKTAIRTDHIAVVVSKNGSAPTWQWGRKDPFIRNSGGTNNELPKTNYSVHSTITAPIIKSTGPVDIDVAIKNPANFYTSNEDYSYSWYKPYEIYNLWSANSNSYGHAAGTIGYDSSPIKTVYDPCPPRYQLPQGNAFTGFTKTGLSTNVTNDINVCGYYDNGWDFYASGWRTGKTIFLPYQACRNSVSGNLQGVNAIGRYWTAAAESRGTSTLLGFNKSEMNINPLSYDGSRGTTFSIRPVLE